MSAPHGMKPGWRMVKFGDVVKNANIVERDIEGAGIERVVGLEHLDTDDLHIRRWGDPSDGTSFTRKFVPGQTLFGKRRAYLRKVAFAEFDGICSGDILTFEPKDRKVLLPELLPFICQTDAFFDHALETSAGSLSPRTSWKAIKGFQLPLPPIKEQKRIAEILWAADDMVEQWRKVYKSTEIAYSVKRKAIFQNCAAVHGRIPLERIGTWFSGGTPTRSRKDLWGGSFPWVSPKDMKCDLITDSEEHLSQKALESRVTTLPHGSVLIVVRGMILAHTFPVALTGTEVAFNQDMKGIILDNSFVPEFVFHWFKDKSSRILQVVEESTHGTKRLASDVLYRMEIPHPPLTEQKESLIILESFRSRLAQLAAHIESSQEISRTLRNSQIGAAHVQ